MDLFRRAVTEPPELRAFRDDKPTLLVSWWCTFYAITIIIIRVCGRYVRTEKIFSEDGTMLLAIIPLLIRMAFVHVVLLFGTNNTVTTDLTAEGIRRREIGSRLVLASRIMYAAYLWAIKYSVSMFLRTLTESVWRSSHQRLLRYLHIMLAVTFLATVISDLAACHPVSHYWQVVPDPGPQCRQGYAHLLTTGILNILTNLALVLFPIPMILKARLPSTHKFSIMIRLALPLVSIALTCYQMPYIISHHFSQPVRSLLASMDMLLATFISNAVVLLSLLQDRGYKKTKYKHGTAKAGFHTRGTIGGDGAGGGGRNSRPTTRWGSDENLMRISEGEGDGKAVLISMEVLKGDRKSVVASTDGLELDAPEVPERARLQEIRVASTWEVRVESDKD